MAASEAKRVSPGQSSRPDGRDEGFMRAALVEVAPAVRRYLFGLCGDWHAAEDAAQEALLKAWSYRAAFGGRSSVRTWVFSIARNGWTDFLRRRAVGPTIETMSPQDQSTRPAGDPSPPASLARGELADAVGRAVARLPDPQREALALRESDGLTFREIGELLGVPVATVKSRVRYALLKLAEDLEPFGRELEP